MTLPDYMECGKVITWHCGNEFYAVTCSLCEDQPLCPLSEFPHHMDIWHTEWMNSENNMQLDETMQEFDDDDDDDGINDLAEEIEKELFDEQFNIGYNLENSLAINDSGCLEDELAEDEQFSDEQITNSLNLKPDSLTDIEPFEQVLIEREPTNTNKLYSNDHANDLSELNYPQHTSLDQQVVAEELEEIEHDNEDNNNMPNVKNKLDSNEHDNELSEPNYEQHTSTEQQFVAESNVCKHNAKQKQTNAAKNNNKIIKPSRRCIKKSNGETERNFRRESNSNRQIKKKNHSKRVYNKIKTESTIKREPGKRISLRKRNVKLNEQHLKEREFIRKYLTKQQQNKLENKQVQDDNNEVVNDHGNSEIVNEGQDKRQKLNRKYYEEISKEEEKEESIKANTCAQFFELQNEINTKDPNDVKKQEITNVLAEKVSVNQEITVKISEEYLRNLEKLEQENSLPADKLHDLEQLEFLQQKSAENHKGSLQEPIQLQEQTTKTKQGQAEQEMIEEATQEDEKAQEVLQEFEMQNIDENAAIMNSFEDFAEEIVIDHEIMEEEICETNVEKMEAVQQGFLVNLDQPNGQRESENIEETTIKANKSNIVELNNPQQEQSRLRRCSLRSNRQLNDEFKEIVEQKKLRSQRASKRLCNKSESVDSTNESNEKFFCSEKLRRTSRNSQQKSNDELHKSKQLNLCLDNLTSNSTFHNQSIMFSALTEPVKNTANLSKNNAQINPQVFENPAKSFELIESVCDTLPPFDNLDSLAAWLLTTNENYGCDEEQTLTPTKKQKPSKISPDSPKTEDEHFELGGGSSKMKLNSLHIRKLIQLYKEHPRLWNQNQLDYCESEKCRPSWQEITSNWNEFCSRQFSVTEVRVRLATLCQRYVKERERRALEGELDEAFKFMYYEELSFLDEQQSLKKRKQIQDAQNEKLIEIFQHYPVLWHIGCYQLKQTKEREQAYENISKALQLCNIHLSSLAVQRRIRGLKKYYRIEKIRCLHAQAEKLPYECEFQYYEQMKKFLDQHMDPFVCRVCSKIFENLTGFRDHLELENHGDILETDDIDVELEANAMEECQTENFVDPSGATEISADNDLIVYSPVTSEDHLFDEGIANENDADDDRSTSSAYFSIENVDASEGQSLKDTESEEALTIKLQYLDRTVDIKLPIEESAAKNTCVLTKDQNDQDFFRQSPVNIRKLINIYQNHSQLWNPNHLDYNSRNARRQSWSTLTVEYCQMIGKSYSWRTLHRKLSDLSKYYKKLKIEHAEGEKEQLDKIVWPFYKDFHFLDDVLIVHSELQKSVHNRENNLKIIEIYQTLPQMWNIDHAGFNKRSLKQLNVELMCSRLQEESNLQITPERLKNRLIELRAQYRAAKKQHLKYKRLVSANELNKKFTADFEFYEEMNFLSAHIDPYHCEPCKMEFKKLTDFKRHREKQHSAKTKMVPSVLDEDNICHICGMKFTLRPNLLAHIQRHDGIKKFSCTTCEKKFFTPYCLKAHERIHTGDYPFTCEKCGMSFGLKSKLNQHLKRHTNQRNFKCDYCPKAFYSAGERDHHVRRHLNIRDKVCPVCGKTFVKGSSYYAHMMLHSDTKRFSCDICEEKFAQYAGLYKHKKRHHKTDSG